MSRTVINQSEAPTDLYAIKYASFGSDSAAALRREVFGDDIGQEGWTTAAAYAEAADFLEVGRTSHVLDVCCGSGGRRRSVPSDGAGRQIRSRLQATAAASLVVKT